ncbi:hypothetical protein K7X08_011300 [Anisodus acutangulus]|uniref:Uncharacterized protein n=1 Tax=Anisodus acutangulus TaxID=402998 RepID=A0A9Q1RAL7_9SOLA|nr:hypothetical protein K7X08_011300 [Anisodus acutangulus]
MKHQDTSSKETSSSLTLQNPVDVCTDVANDKYGGVSGDKEIAQNRKSNICESKVKGVVSMPAAEPRSVVGDSFDSQTAGSKIGLNDSFRLVNTDVKNAKKYRLYLTRFQKEDEAKASFCGMKHQDIYSNETPSSLTLQNPVDVCTDVANDKYGGVSGDKEIAQNGKSNICESKVKGVVSMPSAEPRYVVGDNFDSQTAGSKIGLNDSFRLVNTDVKNAKVPAPYCSTGEAPQPQYKQDFKPHFQSANGSSHQPLPVVSHQIPVDRTHRLVFSTMYRLVKRATDIQVQIINLLTSRTKMKE